MSFSGWHPWIENALVLNLPRLQKQGVIIPNTEHVTTWAWTNSYGESLYTARFHFKMDELAGAIFVSDATGQHKIEMSTTALNFGGRRWWLHCPFTGKRALKLYLYGSIGRFCHRSAIRPQPTYSSQRVSGLDRIMSRRWALRRKLADPGDLFTPLKKPKWMRWKTFSRYAELDEQLADQEEATIFCRWGRFGQVSQLI